MTSEDIKQLISKAESGDIEAMYTLAVIYRDGQDVKQDFEKFLYWLTCLRKRFGTNGKIKSIIRFQNRPESELKSFVAWVQDNAASDSAISMHYLAMIYRDGIGIRKDPDLHIEWLHKAIAAGDVWSMANLAWAYREGIGVEKDPKEYIEWLYKAIAAGDAWSMGNLAWAYREGIGVEKDPKQYIEWLYKAIAVGDAWSMGSMAWAYREGNGLEKDIKQYIEWLRKAIAAGDAWSMGNLAYAYREGKGVKKDLTQYIEWLRKAIAAGHAWSMGDLAWAYKEGIGVDIDSQQSMYWFFRAAEGEDQYALDEIRRMYQSRQFETDNQNDNIIWLTQATVTKDANLFFELALKHKERGQTGDDEKFRYWLKEAENLGNIGAFILRALDSVQELRAFNQSIHNQLMDALVELSRTVETIKRVHLIRDSDSDRDVAHFTTLEALHSMLPVGEESHVGETCLLRLYNIAYMNDPQEGRRLLDLNHEGADLLNGFCATTDQGNNHNFLWEGQEFSVYCGSFTLRIDRLDLWRAYGRDGLGYCLVIPSKTFQQGFKLSPSRLMQGAFHQGEEDYIVKKVNQKIIPALYRIRYQHEEAEETLATLSQSLRKLVIVKHKVNEKLGELINSFVRIIISDILYLYKNEEYASEEEARMIMAHKITDKVLKLDDRQPPHIYVETDAFLFRDAGTRIIVGPKVADKVAAELNLKYRLARHGLLRTTSVEWSKVKYR